LWIQLSNGDGCDTINRFNQATFICLSQARPGFQTSYVEVFLCSVSEGEMIVSFVDIGGIFYHHYLSLSRVNCKFYQNLKYKVYIEKVIFIEILNVHEVQFHKYFAMLTLLKKN
jgi:hypothetical protein